MKYLTIDSQLLFAQSAIHNALNQNSIKNALAEYGYTEERLQAGLALYNEAQSLQTVRDKEYGEQYQATNDLDIARTVANSEYMKHVKIARVAFRDNPGAFEALQVSGRRLRSLSGWIKQAKSFYANALSTPHFAAGLQDFGITQEKLEAGQALVADVETKYITQLKEKGEAQNATLARDIALDNLDQWLSDFISIARIALETNPQHLEMLGIVEPAA